MIRLCTCLVLSLLLVATDARGEETAAPLRAVELTFLKAEAGQREKLKSFIVQNWFEMDRIAKQQGLLRAYTVLDTGSDEGPWNLLVSVTYHDERGYTGVAEAFEKIRQAHQTVLVDGKALAQLGKIVESKRLLEDPAHAVP